MPTAPLLTFRKFKRQTAEVGALPAPDDPTLVVDRLEFERTVFSSDHVHRFTLYRREAPGFDYESPLRPDGQPRDPDRFCAFIGMNPSGASAIYSDATVSRCYLFALRWGFDALYMLNAFSLRSTDPKGLLQVPHATLPENDEWIRKICARAGLVVCAWGKPGGMFKRGVELERILRESVPHDRVKCFGRNRDGTPVHPLYQPSDAQLVPYFS
jgi:hypothetical protein